MTTIKLFVFSSFFFLACANAQVVEKKSTDISNTPPTPTSNSRRTIRVGADQTDIYLPKLKGKSIGLVGNQTSTVGNMHLADYLLSQNVNLKTIFSPEHGFRGKADAGSEIKNGIDPITGLPVTSLYGKNKKPTSQQLQGIDLMIFDIQDVGARFYTYISTLHYVLEACAENHIPVLILDRPNPNGHYVDGPILDTAFHSFVGMHPVPIVHGMTIGEYAQMINGQGWLKNGIKAELEVISCKNYTHQRPYSLPIKPSPNLPNDKAILLYPSLCLLEGTPISIGRGTNKQFQLYGHPDLPQGDIKFVPTPTPGANHPKLEGKSCHGFDLSKLDKYDIYNSHQLNLKYLVDAYTNYPNKEQFFDNKHFFDKLAGSTVLRKQITQGLTAKQIRKTWQKGLDDYKKMRQPYLLYPLE